MYGKFTSAMELATKKGEVPEILVRPSSTHHDGDVQWFDALIVVDEKIFDLIRDVPESVAENVAESAVKLIEKELGTKINMEKNVKDDKTPKKVTPEFLRDMYKYLTAARENRDELAMNLNNVKKTIDGIIWEAIDDEKITDIMKECQAFEGTLSGLNKDIGDGLDSMIKSIASLEEDGYKVSVKKKSTKIKKVGNYSYTARELVSYHVRQHGDFFYVMERGMAGSKPLKSFDSQEKAEKYAESLSNDHTVTITDSNGNVIDSGLTVEEVQQEMERLGDKTTSQKITQQKAEEPSGIWSTIKGWFCGK